MRMLEEGAEDVAVEVEVVGDLWVSQFLDLVRSSL
jgi:hypothetical protein